MNIEFQLGAVDEATRSVRVLASTKEPVKQAYWDQKSEQMKTRMESLASWNLERFRANPIILWMHDPTEPIGRAEDIQETDDGLEMRIVFDPVRVSEKAEKVWRQVQNGTVRGVSVGFNYGAESQEDRNGEPVTVFSANELNETSIVTIPADPGAMIKGRRGWINPDGTDVDHAEESEEDRKARLSKAGRDLAGARKPKTRTDADGDGDGDVTRFDYGSIGGIERTQVGGIKVAARLTRVGVLKYRLFDGSVRRELRLPDEVFKADSMGTLEEATVTDLQHHRGMLHAGNWKEATLGHARGIRQDGDFVAGDLIIQDAKTAAEVESKKLSDISCGYRCKLDWQEGEWKGEHYDAIQRDIRYNHVAVLPPGKGRAGTDVSIRLDGTDAECVSEPNGEVTMKVIKLDGKELEYGSEAHIQHLESAHMADIEKADAREQELTKERDELQAKFDAAEAARKKREEDDEEEMAKASAEQAKRFKSRLRLLQRALKFLDEDEEKTDSLAELEPRDLMIKVLQTQKQYENFDGADRSDDYVQALFDAVTAQEPQSRVDGVSSVVKAAELAKRSDASDSDDPVRKAREAMIERNRERGNKPLGAS